MSLSHALSQHSVSRKKISYPATDPTRFNFNPHPHA